MIDPHPSTLPDTSPKAAAPPPDPFAALIERWFVTYNPVYLLSAALVLGGLWLVGRDFAERRVLGVLGVSIIAELYALALIGGAAILHRAGQRRPAVMLGLLAALYQCDLTLTVEMCGYLGGVGWMGTLGWIVLFVAKLRMLGAALGLRLSRSALVVPALGAAAIGLGPQLLPYLDHEARGAVVAFAVLGIGAAGAASSRSIACEAGFDVRGRRAIHGLWWLGAAAGLAHVVYWGGNGVPLWPTFIALALLGTRRLKREHHVWAVVLAVLALTAWSRPSTHLGTAALMAAAILALRGLRSPVPATDSPRTVTPPYRGATEPRDVSDITELAAPLATFAAAPFEERARLLLGAAACAHLGLTATLSPAPFPGVAWPEHQLVLDVALVLVCTFAAWRWRRWRALSALLPASAHLAAMNGWLAWPTTALGWGGSAIGLGFLSLGAAIGASLWSPAAHVARSFIDGAPRAGLRCGMRTLAAFALVSSLVAGCSCESGIGPRRDGGDGTDGGTTPRDGATADGTVTFPDVPPFDANLSPETCDGIDNDGNGIVDDLDVGMDGVCDCLRVATLGVAGSAGVSGVFSAWLDARSTLGATDLGDTVLTAEVLAPFQVILSQNISGGHARTADEVAALEAWIRAGGGFDADRLRKLERTNVNLLLGPSGIQYGPEAILMGSGGTVPINGWNAHPLSEMVSRLGIDNGYPVIGSGTVVAFEGGYDVLRATELGAGHVLVWGDEWISFDSEWVGHPDYQVERFWLNALKWLTPAAECQVPIVF